MEPNPVLPPRPKAPKASQGRRPHRVDVRVTVRAVLRPLTDTPQDLPAALQNGSGAGSDAAPGPGPEIYGWVRNLSPGGAAVSCAQSLPPDTPCDVRLVWKDGPVFRAVFLRGWVVYTTEAGMGVQFEGLSPELKEVLDGLDRHCAAPAA